MTLNCCPQILEDIEALQYNKGPWVELDDIALHYIRIL